MPEFLVPFLLQASIGVLWSASMLAFFIWLTKSPLYGTALVIVVSLVIAVIDTMMGKIKWPYGKDEEKK